jgi:hypothetical protein
MTFVNSTACAACEWAALLVKIRLEVLVLDDDAETVVEAIAKHARTETIGDGKIWVTQWTAPCVSEPALVIETSCDYRSGSPRAISTGQGA